MADALNERRARHRAEIALQGGIVEIVGDGDLTIDHDGGSPVINLVMSWGISDLAAARRYVPNLIVKPKLYDWFQRALVRGSIPRGTIRLSGPLDKFPFREGEGRFLVEGSVRLSVTDAGPGIPPEWRERIFEPYARRDTLTARGSGIGLYAARRLADAMGARLWCEPGHPDGARFVVAMPAVVAV